MSAVLNGAYVVAFGQRQRAKRPRAMRPKWLAWAAFIFAAAFVNHRTLIAQLILH